LQKIKKAAGIGCAAAGLRYVKLPVGKRTAQSWFNHPCCLDTE
jgi:hypothetical protein